MLGVPVYCAVRYVDTGWKGSQMSVWHRKRLSKDELDAAFKKFESPAVQAKIKEGFDQIERGEYVVITMEEIKRNIGLASRAGSSISDVG